MSTLIKFSDLTLTAISSLVLKLLSILCLILTLFIPILNVHFTGSGLNALITFFTFNATLTITQGSSNALPTHFSTRLLNFLFIVVILGIVITIIFLVVHHNRYASFTNTFSILVLFFLFLDYFLITTLNDRSLNGVTVSVSDDLGFFMIIFSLILLFVSSFAKFDLKTP